MMVLGFLILLAATPDTPVPVLLPPRASPPVALKLEWLDRAGAVLREEERQVVNGGLLLDAPAGALSFQVVGGGFSSRILTPAAARKRGGIPLQATGQVRIRGLPEVESATLLFWNLGREEDGSLEEKKIPVEKEGGKGRLALERPAGRYALACDAGPAFAPVIFPEIEVVPGQSLDLSLPNLSGNTIAVTARDRDTKKPMRGARLIITEEATPADRLLQTLLARRAGESGADGVLRFGALAPGPVALTIGADKRRTATLRLDDGFESGKRDVALAPFQRLEASLTGLDLKREGEGKGLALVAGTCRMRERWMPCTPADMRRHPLDENGRAVFLDMPPGFARVSLEQNGRRTAFEMVAISAHSEDPDAATLELFLRPLRIRGVTQRRGGDPVEARVLAHSSGNDSVTLAETRSAADGSFDLSFYLPWAQGFGLRAETESPRGAGRWFPRAPVSPLFLGADDVVIVVNTGEFRLTLKDRKTGEGIPQCKVVGRFQNAEDSSGTNRTLESDDQGVVRFGELGRGNVHFVPLCKGYTRTEGVSYDIDPDVEREETMLLDRASDLTVQVLDSRGAPQAGARLFGVDVLSPRDPVGGAFTSPTVLGETDADGKMQMDGGQWLGIPFYVVAAGQAIHAGRFPAATECSDISGCSMTVSMEPLRDFPGIRVQVPESARAFGHELVFFRGAAAIPNVVIYAACVANGIASSELWDREGSQIVNWTPRLFEQGEYQAVFVGSGARMTLGTFQVPSNLPVEFKLPASSKPGD